MKKNFMSLGLQVAKTLGESGMAVQSVAAMKVRNDQEGGFHPMTGTQGEGRLDLVDPCRRNVVNAHMNRHCHGAGAYHGGGPPRRLRFAWRSSW
jgi:hypothetical protein